MRAMDKMIAVAAVIGLVVISYGLSWIITCGVIKLITMCFGWIFKWPVATGIWLIMCLARGIFKNSSSK